MVPKILMPYDAITIDSNVAIHTGINLETGLLAQLFQFKEGPVDFVISDVVLREIRKHLNKNTKKARDAALASVRNAVDLELFDGIVATASLVAVEGMIDSRDAVRIRLRRFLIETGANLAPSSLVSADQVMERYFLSKAPFDETGPKKNEFPDAIALLALEKWATSNGKKILAVSADKGWQAFAEGNAHIDVEPDLGAALAKLQLHTDQAVSTVSAFLRAIETGQSPEQAAELQSSLDSSIMSLEVRAEAESFFYYELDSVELNLSSFEILEVGNSYDIRIVRMGAEEIVAQVGAILNISAEAEFSLSIKDGIDKDYVSMGGAVSNKQVIVEGDILLTIGGVLDGPLEELVVTDAEVLKESLKIDFGTLDLEHEEDDYQAWLDEDQDADVEQDVAAEGNAAASDGS